LDLRINFNLNFSNIIFTIMENPQTQNSTSATRSSSTANSISNSANNSNPTSNSASSQPRTGGNFRPNGGGQGGAQRSVPGGNSQGRDGNRGGFARRDSQGGAGRGGQGGQRRGRRQEEESNLDNKVLQVKRVTKVVKGGKNTRFSALVVVGDKNGKVGFALCKGLDYQDAVNKAAKKAKESLIHIKITTEGSLDFAVHSKYNASIIYLKPAQSGTGLIAGGFLRPVLELAGIQNIYSKIIGSNNKIVGIQSVFEALKNYEKKEITK